MNLGTVICIGRTFDLAGNRGIDNPIRQVAGIWGLSQLSILLTARLARRVPNMKEMARHDGDQLALSGGC